jgi:hypothetical protein
MRIERGSVSEPIELGCSLEPHAVACVRTISGRGGSVGRLSCVLGDDGDCKQVHEAILEVLEKTGVEVKYPPALELFSEAGAHVTGTRVRIEGELVEKALSSAPSSCEVSSRERPEVLTLSPLIANRSAKDWYELFPNAVVAEGVLDRLVNSSFHVHVEGKSYRSRRRPGQDPQACRGRCGRVEENARVNRVGN